VIIIQRGAAEIFEFASYCNFNLGIGKLRETLSHKHVIFLMI